MKYFLCFFSKIHLNIKTDACNTQAKKCSAKCSKNAYDFPFLPPEIQEERPDAIVGGHLEPLEGVAEERPWRGAVLPGP